jgi:hypothetical protein
MAFGYGYNASAYSEFPYNGASGIVRAVLERTQDNQLIVSSVNVFVTANENISQNNQVLFSNSSAFVIADLSTDQDSQSINATVIRIVTLDLSNVQEDNTSHICAYTGIAKFNSNIVGIDKHIQSNALSKHQNNIAINNTVFSSAISSHSSNSSVSKIERSC